MVQGQDLFLWKFVRAPKNAGEMLLSQRFRRNLPLVASVVALSLLWSFVRIRHDSFRESSLNSNGHPTAVLTETGILEQGSQTCAPDIERLRDSTLALTESFLYSRRCIRPVWGSRADRKVVTKLDQSLITQSTEANLTRCQEVQLPSCEPLLLDVPYPYPAATYPHLQFGVATDYDRLVQSLPGFTHWLSGTGARLLAIIVDEDGGPNARQRISDLVSLYASHGIDFKAMPRRDQTLGVSQNHFTIISELLETATSDTKWLGVIDDDTFFPSLYRLDKELQKHDHTAPSWLGALSEDFDVVKWLGMMAFGGAGTFLSVPLAEQLVPHIPDCLTLPQAVAKNATGDGLLRDCIYEHTSTKLTIVDGLYQHDLRGDISGFYESGVQPLSVHHWRSWYKVPMPQMAVVTKLCGDCFLQRWQFGKDTLLANGFSVTQYADELDNVDLGQMEGTWSNPGHEFDFSLGPLRSAIDDNKKKTYRLRDATFMEDGSLRQIYVYSNPLGEEPDHVLELSWEAHRGLLH